MRTGKAQGIKTNCIRVWGTLMLLFMLGMMRLTVYGAEEFSVQELSGEGTVTSDSLNIRSGPGTEYDVVGKAAKGTVLVVTGQADNGWYRIELEGKNGYASGKYITFEAKADVSEQDPQEQTSGTGMGYISQRYIDYLKTAGIIFGMVVVVIMIFITLKGIGKSRRDDEEYEDEEYDEEEDDDGYDDEEYGQDEEEDEEPVRKPRKEPKAPKASDPIKISEEDYQLHIDPIYFEEEKPLPQPDHVSPEDQNTKTQDLQKAMKKLGELQEEIERLKTEK